MGADECLRLIDAARKGPIVGGMPGPQRALLYRLALETGLRGNELVTLTVSSFQPENDKPTVTVKAAFSKHRRTDVLPLRSELAAVLKEHLRLKLAGTRVFTVNKFPRYHEMIQADLAAARKAWLEEAATPQERAQRAATSFLAYRDEEGKVADFHGLRGSFLIALERGGVHPRVAQSLARHSDINLTMGVYTHIQQDQEREALKVLPDLGKKLA